jgi:hypothetical protein
VFSAQYKKAIKSMNFVSIENHFWPIILEQ